MKRKLIASVIAASMIVASLSGCSSSKKADNPNPTTNTSDAASSNKPLVIGSDPLSEKFSGFFHSEVSDETVANLTLVKLATFGRDGELVPHAADGETVAYNGKDYTYKGISNVDVNFDKASNITTYDIKLRNDVKFSDGKPLTADDVIFSLYVVSDPTYDGGIVFGSQNIVGMKNYRANSTAAESITAADIAKVLKEMPKELADSIKKQIVDPAIDEAFETVKSYYDNDAYKDLTKQFKDPKDLFASSYSLKKDYDSTKVKDEKQVVADLKAQYGADYKSLGEKYQQDEECYNEDVNKLAQTYIVEKKKAAGEGKDVPNIEGIKKISDTEVQIKANGYDASLIYQLDMGVQPLHYYGDTSMYDYDNNKFGFTRGDLSKIKEKTTKPLGAGPYKFVKYENKVVYYEANENYYLGAPKIKNLQIKESTQADKVTGLVQGTVDLTDPTASKTVFEQIKKENSNGELSGDKIVVNSVDNLGYGYICMNAKTIRVGDDGSSEQSKNLRKAIATLISVYRDVSIDTYYGDAASVIQYPISNTSWAAPQKSDSDYHIAFSKDVKGNDIYTDSMSADDKYAAAKKAALGYLEAAGYTIKNVKAVAAPKGAKMEYEVLIPGDGTGDHPAFGMLTDVKQALGELGITLTINDLANTAELWTKVDSTDQELWVAAWQATQDPDMYQIYHSDNIPGHGKGKDNRTQLADKKLDELIFKARESADKSYRKTVYKQCLDIVLDWAVEIPTYQRLNCIGFSPERIKSESVTPDISPFYKWYREIEKFEMK